MTLVGFSLILLHNKPDAGFGWCAMPFANIVDTPCASHYCQNTRRRKLPTAIYYHFSPIILAVKGTPYCNIWDISGKYVFAFADSWHPLIEAMINGVAGKWVTLTLIKNQSGDKDQTPAPGNCFANCTSAWMCVAERGFFAQRSTALNAALQSLDASWGG